MDTQDVHQLKSDGVEVLELEITSAVSISAAVRAVSGATEGRLDTLVNNAAIIIQRPLIDHDIMHLRRMYEINVIGPLALSQQVAPLLLKSKQGMIVNLGSGSGSMAPPWLAGYASTKAALNMLSDSLRVELKPLGIEVLIVGAGGQDNFGPEPQTDRYPLFPAIAAEFVTEISKNDRNIPDANTFAAQLVTLIEKRKGGHVYLGGDPPWMRYVLPNLSWGVRDRIMARIGKLDLATPTQEAMP